MQARFFAFSATFLKASAVKRFVGRRLDSCSYDRTLSMKTKPHIAVIGAGAFGGWTALHLLKRGPRVTLLDGWGPGNSRASSGGETRVMRGTSGPDHPSTEMAARGLKPWQRTSAGGSGNFFIA